VEKLEGVVMRRERRFLFILGEDRGTYFIMPTEVHGGIRLRPGDRVRFCSIEKLGHLFAHDIEVLNPVEAPPSEEAAHGR
jgi:hypothetical protein